MGKRSGEGAPPDVPDDAARRGPSDEELLERAGSSSENAASRLEAFLELFERHRRAAVSYAARVTGDLGAAETLVRGGFAKAAAEASRAPRRSSFRTWLFAVLVRAVREHAEAGRGSRRFDAIARAGALPEDAEDLLAEAATFFDGLGRLDVRRREAVCLRLLERMSVEDSAAATGARPEEFRRLLGSAAEALRTGL